MYKATQNKQERGENTPKHINNVKEYNGILNHTINNTRLIHTSTQQFNLHSLYVWKCDSQLQSMHVVPIWTSYVCSDLIQSTMVPHLNRGPHFWTPDDYRPPLLNPCLATQMIHDIQSNETTTTTFMVPFLTINNMQYDTHNSPTSELLTPIQTISLFEIIQITRVWFNSS